MSFLSNYVDKNIEILQKIYQIDYVIEEVCERILFSIEKGGKIIVLGNGGSASDSMHIASELVGFFEKKRKPIAWTQVRYDNLVRYKY